MTVVSVHPAEENEVVAEALEAAADAHDTGSFSVVYELYDPTLLRVLEINDRYGEVVAFAFTFWDNWVDASNHQWHHHEPLTEADWPRYARVVADALRRGQLPDDPVLLESTLLPPRQSLLTRLKTLLFGAR